jgi:hypothetical protein
VDDFWKIVGCCWTLCFPFPHRRRRHRRRRQKCPKRLPAIMAVAVDADLRRCRQAPMNDQTIHQPCPPPAHGAPPPPLAPPTGGGPRPGGRRLFSKITSCAVLTADADPSASAIDYRRRHHYYYTLYSAESALSFPILCCRLSLTFDVGEEQRNFFHNFSTTILDNC